jgi:hypothetical protein
MPDSIATEWYTNDVTILAVVCVAAFNPFYKSAELPGLTTSILIQELFLAS